MADGVIYLDIDDEITSAASRVRSAERSRVAVVLPYGSRVATSRINFRLLARDAQTNGKQLSVIANDPATRALAGSAGLPIFATVADYESSLGRDAAADDEGDDPGGGPGTAAGAGAAATGAGDGAAAMDAATDAEGTAEDDRPGPLPLGLSFDDDTAALSASATVVTPASAGSAATRAVRVPAAAAERPAARTFSAIPAARVVADTTPAPSDRSGAGPSDVRPSSGVRTRPAPATRPWSAVPRNTLLTAVGVLALALVVGAVGSFLLLPTATAVITPRESTIGPIPLRITASTAATAPDPASNVVPATEKSVDVDVTATFPVTGKRVEEEFAIGTVRFRNKDFTRSNSIPKGSVVSTQGGIRFRTVTAITVPRAELVGLQIFPASASVDVKAVQAGLEGNVEPNTILVIPRGEDPLTLDVTNPDATTGGTREEFPRVAQEDIDTAVISIDQQLQVAFDDRLDDPDLIADGATVFAETADLGDPLFLVDPATFLGQEIETFDLGATARGTVLTVDEAPVQVVAEANIAGNVEAGYELVAGSSAVDPDPAVVDAGVITFPVTVTARQRLIVDPAAIEDEIRGRPLAEARSVLEGYGTVQLSVWPDWVGTIPTFDARVEILVQDPITVETPSPPPPSTP